jgi:uncharacterized protein
VNTRVALFVLACVACALTATRAFPQVGNDLTLIDAARAADATAVQRLLTKHVDVNATASDGMTALHWAVHHGAVDIVDTLLRAGADPSAVTRYDVSPLMLAIWNGDERMVERLMAAGADPRQSRPEGDTLLMHAARIGEPAIVKSLIAHGLDVGAREHWLGQTALMWAAAEDHAEIVHMLADAGADLEATARIMSPPQRDILDSRTDKDGAALQVLQTTFPRGGFTALLFASRNGSVKSAEVLVRAGADLNHADPDGITPLHIAIRNAHYDVAALLIQAGADVNAVDRVGSSPLYVAVDMNSLDWMPNQPPPRRTGTLSSLDLVKMLLTKGAAPNATLRSVPLGWREVPPVQNAVAGVLGPGTTAFIRAAKNADLDAMRVLLDAGADPNLTTAVKTTAMMAAVGGIGRKEGLDFRITAVEETSVIAAVTLCLARGADVNARNALGQTALHAAAKVGATHVVEFLAGHGADLHLRTADGATPLDEALRGMPNIDGGAGEPHHDTAASIRRLMSAADPAGR